jgi:hypothetical protein
MGTVMQDDSIFPKHSEILSKEDIMKASEGFAGELCDNYVMVLECERQGLSDRPLILPEWIPQRIVPYSPCSF